MEFLMDHPLLYTTVTWYYYGILINIVIVTITLIYWNKTQTTISSRAKSGVFLFTLGSWLSIIILLFVIIREILNTVKSNKFYRKKPLLVELTGTKGSGKTTFGLNLAYYLKQEGYTVYFLSFADPIKHILSTYFSVFKELQPVDAVINIDKGFETFKRENPYKFPDEFFNDFKEQVIPLFHKIYINNDHETKRKVYQTLGDLIQKHMGQEFFVNEVIGTLTRIHDFIDVVFIDDLRYKHEDLRNLSELPEYSFKIIKLLTDVEQNDTHSSETELKEITPDLVIPDAKTVDVKSIATVLLNEIRRS